MLPLSYASSSPLAARLARHQTSPPPRLESVLKLVRLPGVRSAFSLAPPLFLSLRRICTPSMAPPVHVFHPVPHPGPGGPETDAGVAISQLFQAGGPGTTVFLVPRALYTLYSSIEMSHPGTTLATQGFPSFESGDQAVLETRAEKESVAVRMLNLGRTAVKRIHFRGCRGWGAKAPTDEEKERWKGEGRMGWLEGGGPLVVMGGPQAHEQMLEGCRLEDPRGWTGVSCSCLLVPVRPRRTADPVPVSRRSTSSTLRSAAASSTTLSARAASKLLGHGPTV